MATLYTDRYKRTNLDNRCMSFNGNAATVDCNMSNFILELNGGKTRAKIESCEFSSNFSISGYYDTVQIRAKLVSNSGTIDSPWVGVKISSSNKIPKATFTFSNVTPDFLSGVTKIQIECQSYDSRSDLYYRGNSSYPQYFTIKYYAEEEVLPSTPTITSITYNTVGGKLPITTRHSATINIGAPSWGGTGTESDLERKYEILIKEGSLTVKQVTTSSPVASYTFNSNYYSDITASKSLTVQIRAKNAYGYSSYSSISNINFYGITMSAPTINGNSSTQNPFTDLSGQKLIYNSNYSALFSTQKEFYFDWSILSTKFSYTNRGYPTTIELEYSIDGVPQSTLSSPIGNNRIRLTASQFLQIIKITKVKIVTTIDGTNGTFRYYKDSYVSNASVKIGTELSAVITSTWKTGSTSSRVYDGTLLLKVIDAGSIRYVNMKVTFSDGTSYPVTKAALTSASDGSKTYSYVFKDIVTSRNYIGKTISNVTISLLDSNSNVQGFKYNGSETIYETYTLNTADIRKTFISSWNAPSNVAFNGDYGANALYNEGSFTWNCEAESDIAFAVKIGTTTIEKNRVYSYLSYEKTVYNNVVVGSTNEIILNFTDPEYNIPFSGGNNYTINNITKYSVATLRPISMQTAFNKYSAWDSSGNLLPTEYSFTLSEDIFSPSTSGDITYRITCSAPTLMLKIGTGSYAESTVQYNNYNNDTVLYLKTSQNTSVGGINYFIGIEVIGNSKVLEILASSITLNISNNNLPPYDKNELRAIASNIFKTTNSYYFVPELSEVTVSHNSGKNLRDSVKFEPNDNFKKANLNLMCNNTVVSGYETTNLNVQSYRFLKPYNLTNTDDKKIELRKIFTASNDLQSSNMIDVLFDNNSIKMGNFYISKPAFNTAAQTPIDINKDSGEVTIYINYNYNVTNEINTYGISNTDKIYINFSVAIYGSQTGTTETHSIKVPFETNMTITNKQIKVTFTKDFVTDNTSFNIILTPSIVGIIEGNTELKTFVSGEESIVYSLNLDTPDFAVRKHRISINRTPAAVDSPDLASIEVQAHDINYNYMNFYNHTGVKIGTIHYIFDDNNENGYVLIDSGSW